MMGLERCKHAATYGHMDIVRYLLSQGVDVNHAGTKGWIFLHQASQLCITHQERGSSRLLANFLSLGADLTRHDNDGLGALEHAATVQVVT